VPAAVAAALGRLGHAACAIEDDPRLVARLRRERPDFVVNLAEGRSGRGREAIVPSICEHLGLPYTGSDALTLAASLDKDVARRLSRRSSRWRRALVRLQAPPEGPWRSGSCPRGSRASAMGRAWSRSCAAENRAD
jgi:hypothetical protein